jgi:hypothetical protein
MNRAMRITALALQLVLLSTVMFGCGTYRTCRLPLSSASAPSVFLEVASAARGMGLEVAEFESAVHVRLDEVTWAHFAVQVEEVNLVIRLDDDTGSEAERTARFDRARERAEVIWRKAVLVARGAHPVDCSQDANAP